MDMTERVSNDTNVTNASALENLFVNNMKHDLHQAAGFPDLDNTTNDTEGRHGLGQLGANLEFMMLKLAQLETVIELQQIEIHKLNEWKNIHMAGEHNSPQPSSAMNQQNKLQAEQVLKKVLQKQNHQRMKREFVVPSSQGTQTQKEVKQAKAVENKTQLLQRRASKSVSEKSLDNSVSTKVLEDIGDVVTDGTGLMGDALGDAYEAAEDQVAFVANTAIDSVEMAVDILVPGLLLRDVS